MLYCWYLKKVYNILENYWSRLFQVQQSQNSNQGKPRSII
mgnify:CR=1 FL=1